MGANGSFDDEDKPEGEDGEDGADEEGGQIEEEERGIVVS